MRTRLSLCIASLSFACGPRTQSLSSNAPGSQTTSDDAAIAAAVATLSPNSQPVCAATKGMGTCNAMVRLDTSGAAWTSNVMAAGFTAQDIQAMYNVPIDGGEGVTVAVLAFGEDPAAEDDLAWYREHMNLKACTTADGCFRKVNDQGQLIYPDSWGTAGVQQPASMPATDWSAQPETSIDMEMVSAACPKCNIVLVEGPPLAQLPGYAFTQEIVTEVNAVVVLGATVVTCSYDEIYEDAASVALGEKAFNIPGVTFFVASGDDGFQNGPEYPSSSGHAIAVGGTNVAKNSDGTFTEAAWNFSTSGCSGYVDKPAWQTDTGCQNRMTTDISAVGDPQTGVAVYMTYEAQTIDWSEYGGTSVSAPLSAGIFAAAGLAGKDPSFVYAHPEAFNDVTAGATAECTESYQCSAGPGYDGPTGLGSPKGDVLATLAQ